eukprot:gene30096-39292_t
MEKDSIDLMNVDYEDVLQLYKGLRKSETILKDKNKELAAMKLRVQQLQESHSKFRGQIQALESVKELTVTLQSQLSMMQHELHRLETDNNELTEMNNQAEMIIQEKTAIEERQNRMLSEIQIDFTNLKDRYEEKLKFQKELEKLIFDEQSLRRAAEARASSGDETRDDLREENRQLKMKLDNAMLKLSQCDQELAHASEQLIILSKQLKHIPESEKQIGTLEVENANLKGDIARLIRLVEYSPAKKELADMWHDSGGLVFVGMGDKNDDLELSDVRRSQLFDLHGATTGEGSHSTAGLAFTNASITPSEFAQMKRLHGGDPFPLSANLSDEAEYWVPGDAARLGIQFMQSKLPHAPSNMANERKEKSKARERSIQCPATGDETKTGPFEVRKNHKPYKGVLAERQIRRLQAQHKEDRLKLLTGRAMKATDERAYTADDFDGDEELQQLLRQPPGRLDMTAVSQEKLLVASLNSLESLGQKLKNTSMNSLNYSSAAWGSPEDDMGPRRGGKGTLSSPQQAQFPGVSYLRGALWIARNWSVISEELASEMESFKSKQLDEISTARSDDNLRRCAQRLTLLAGAAVTEVVTIANKFKLRTDRIIEILSKVEPGDSRAFEDLLRVLPMESINFQPLLRSGSTSSPQRRTAHQPPTIR